MALTTARSYLCVTQQHRPALLNVRSHLAQHRPHSNISGVCVQHKWQAEVQVDETFPVCNSSQHLLHCTGQKRAATTLCSYKLLASGHLQAPTGMIQRGELMTLTPRNGPGICHCRVVVKVFFVTQFIAQHDQHIGGSRHVESQPRPARLTLNTQTDFFSPQVLQEQQQQQQQ